MKFAILATIPLTVLLSGCGSSLPDCGSSDAKASAIEIIKTSQLSWKLINVLDFNSDAELKELWDKVSEPGLTKEESQPRVDAWVARKNELEKQIRDTGPYDIEEIVTSNKDESTKNVSCKAVATLRTSNFGSSKIDIVYTVEQTSDGKLKVTLYDQ